ncbi:hypothetical protein [Ornithinimicrobium cerasi]|uniref:Uncharacterized protein n=1 Tax=Ornithinimicrobium cerasi TaxID=2248773 RepID=A0A285VS14_9MICO|nr:hypothetical protein [Ornithinimicrobium cerasi]SOC56839.1 hypothetical protein SAMN05421879_10948 [Ornithinimicrobium cerasi]
MRSTTLTMGPALGLTLLLAGCSPDDPGAGSTGTATTSADAGAAATTDGTATTQDGSSTLATGAPMTDEACAGFFQNVPVTLAERSERARAALEAGDVVDPASWAEVNLLKQRVETLVVDAEDETAALLERVNAPFEEASAAVLDDPEQSPGDAEITVPEIDVTDSAAAQEELLATCTG